MEASSVLYKEAYDFLVAVAEPVSRPTHIHKYKLSTTSLLAAVSIGLNTELILRTLNKFSKTPLPEIVKTFVKECTQTYGKAKLVLRKGKYYVESHEEDILNALLNNSIIRNARILDRDKEIDTEEKQQQQQFTELQAAPDGDEWLKLLLSNLDDDDDIEEDMSREAEALQRHGQNGLSKQDAERLTSLKAGKVQAFTIDKNKYKLVCGHFLSFSLYAFYFSRSHISSNFLFLFLGTKSCNENVVSSN